jgi:hypothetical protein
MLAYYYVLWSYSVYIIREYMDCQNVVTHEMRRKACKLTFTLTLRKLSAT